MKRCRKLTPEQKKAAWAPTEENAGAGWCAKGREEWSGSRERDTTPRLDEIFRENEDAF